MKKNKYLTVGNITIGRIDQKEALEYHYSIGRRFKGGTRLRLTEKEFHNLRKAIVEACVKWKLPIKGNRK